MTEEELMKTFCPHISAPAGRNKECIGSACSQYREKPVEDWRLTQLICKKDDPIPDPLVWKESHRYTSGVIGYSRITSITANAAWCGLAGVPHYAET